MIASLRPTLLRRAVVVLTVAAIVVCLGPLWLVEAVCRRVRREFGEDIAAAWRGQK